MFLMLLLALLLTSCETQTTQNQQLTSITDRIDRPLYHAAIPPNWTPLGPDPHQPLADTTLPIAAWTVDDMKITVHNFPAETLEKRIPPQAQVARWLKQIEKLNEEMIHVVPSGHSGYLGLMMEAEGESEGMIAWSMQLAPEHFLALSSRYPQDPHVRADYTIKATGPKETVAKHRDDILSFAKSFELIHEIPAQ